MTRLHELLVLKTTYAMELDYKRSADLLWRAVLSIDVVVPETVPTFEINSIKSAWVNVDDEVNPFVE